MRQEGEPSVEQILRSIKKVMARDAERAFASREGSAASVAVPGPEPQAEVRAQVQADPETQPQPDPETRPEPADEEEAAELRDTSAIALPEEPRAAEAELVEPFPHSAAPEADDLIEDEADGEAEIDADTDSQAAARELPEEEPAEPSLPATGEALTSAATAAATRRSLAALAMLTDPAAPLPTGPAGDAALQAIVRELLQPMLSQWLEAHLPAVVEGEVRAEIARITAGPGAAR